MLTTTIPTIFIAFVLAVLGTYGWMLYKILGIAREEKRTGGFVVFFILLLFVVAAFLGLATCATYSV